MMKMIFSYFKNLINIMKIFFNIMKEGFQGNKMIAHSSHAGEAKVLMGAREGLRGSKTE